MSETVPSVAAGREFLAIPGPTNVPDAVLQAMHRPAVDIYTGPLVELTDSLLRDLKRVNAHITSVAYPILDEVGQLRESRLRSLDKKAS